MDRKRLIEVLQEHLHHKDVVVCVASLILAQLVKGYAVQIVKGDTLELLGVVEGGALADEQPRGDPQNAEWHHGRRQVDGNYGCAHVIARALCRRRTSWRSLLTTGRTGGARGEDVLPVQTESAAIIVDGGVQDTLTG